MWSRLLEQAGVKWKIYLPIQTYDDAEATAIIQAASEISQTPTSAIVEDFGEFIAPNLVKMYASLKKPEWRTLDVIEHTENVIHTVVRMREPGAQPPYLKCTRLSPNEVRLIYDSPRQLRALAKGIAKGLGRLYGERIEIHETICMHVGADHCELFMKTV